VGGLTGSTLITLVLIPVVYSLFHPDPRPDCR
jgi:HAE1 family hydrophobic/amphiphilic exporter-1